MDAHRMQPQQVLDALGVDAAQGLNSADVPARRERYGANEFTREKPPSVFRRILENLKDPMLVMLIIAVARSGKIIPLVDDTSTIVFEVAEEHNITSSCNSSITVKQEGNGVAVNVLGLSAAK